MRNKRIALMMAALLLVTSLLAVAPIARAEIASGKFGDCDWSISDEGVLTIGPGKLASNNVHGNVVPGWQAYADQIMSVVVQEGVVANTNQDFLFVGLSKVTSFDVGALDVSNTTSLRGMFQGCRGNATIAGLDKWDTSKVTSLHDMFRSSSFKDLSGIQSWNTANVRIMDSFLAYASIEAKTTLDLSGWDVSKVTDLNFAFARLSIHDYSIAGWSPVKPHRIPDAFAGTMNRLDLSNWNNLYISDPPAPLWFFTNVWGVRPRVIILNPNFKFYEGDGFTGSPDSNDEYTGKWQAVGAGTEENPAGATYTTPELRALYTGSAPFGPAETYVWEKKTVDVGVSKVWQDDNDQAGARPEKVTIKLLADGKDTGKALELNAANNWQDAFKDLTKYEGTERITYTIEEVALGEKYTSQTTGNADTGFTVTNTFVKPVDPVDPDPVDPIDPVDPDPVDPDPVDPDPVDPDPVDPPEPTYPTLSVPLTAKKVLKNASLKADAFTFQLKDGKGKVLSEIKNAADGSISFPDRTFSKVVSDYRYTVTEVAGSDPKMSYDDTAYTVKVTTKAVSGKLEATVSLEKNGMPYEGPITFTNVRKVPPTGDSLYQTLSLLLGLSALLMGSAWVITRKRRQGA